MIWQIVLGNLVFWGLCIIPLAIVTAIIELYTKYKTAGTPEQQEQARKEYLEKAGIPTSFRW